MHAPVEVISLDHDLGLWEDGRELTGYDVLVFIEEMVYSDLTFQVPEMNAHTANPVARDRMTKLIERINRCNEQNKLGDTIARKWLAENVWMI